MKKLFPILFAFLSLQFNSCLPTPSTDLIDDLYDDYKDEELIEAGQILSVEYSAFSSPNIIEVNSNIARLKISNIPSGKTVWMTKTNPSKTAINAQNTRRVTSAENITLSKANFNDTSVSRSAFNEDFSSEAHYIHLEDIIIPLEADSSRSITKAASSNSVTKITPVVNSTKKTIYIDKSIKEKKFEQETATLRAVGEYCYVWVVGNPEDETYWTDDESPAKEGQQVNSGIVQNIARVFDKIYPMVRTVFGNESDQIISYTEGFINMSESCDTGTKVNIVIYDINNDFKSTESSSVVGYFYSKDYYKGYNTVAYSNAGKYFYIDAYYAVNRTSTVLSTLAHEFQHMINFSVKTIPTLRNVNPVSSSSWYNEMLSMLCEDLIKAYLKETYSDFTDEDSPFQRLPLFCRHYYDIGLEYNDKDYDSTIYSYANNYAFGAWAARNYGGVSFIHKMSTNTDTDIDSITKASGATITDMLKNFSAACVINKEDYGFNKSLLQGEFASNDYYYPLDEIDLWGLDDVLPKLYKEHSNKVPSGISNYYSFKGPVYFGYNSQVKLRPYGVNLVKVGVTNDSDVSITFNKSSVSSVQKTYIIIE